MVTQRSAISLVKKPGNMTYGRDVPAELADRVFASYMHLHGSSGVRRRSWESHHRIQCSGRSWTRALREAASRNVALRWAVQPVSGMLFSAGGKFMTASKANQTVDSKISTGAPAH